MYEEFHPAGSSPGYRLRPRSEPVETNCRWFECGIEVKAGATVHPRDFKGLARLKEAAGRRFACGIVLHDGDRIQQAGPKLFAMPVSVIWES